MILGNSNQPNPQSLLVPGKGNVGAVLLTLVPAMLAYNGFRNLGPLGGEVANPKINIPRAAIIGPALVIGLYLLINFTYFHILGFTRVAQSQYVASDTIASLIGQTGAQFVTVAMIVSAFGALHATFLSGPRIPFAMAHDGYFFAFTKRIHPVFHSPSGAVIFQGGIAILLVLSGTYQELYSFNMFAVWLFFALTAVALIRLRIKEPELPRAFRVWGYPWTPAIFGIVACAIALNLWLARPIRSSVGLAIILIGVPFFYR